jgi:hypothetical protein
MSLEHSPAHQKKRGPKSSAAPVLKRLLTREQVAERYHVTPAWVTRNYRKLGWKPIKYGKRVLFTEDQLIESDRRALTGF